MDGSESLLFFFLILMERIRLRCKACERRVWIKPFVVGKRVVFRCPKCFVSGSFFRKRKF